MNDDIQQTEKKQGQTQKIPYEAPRFWQIGSIAELTLGSGSRQNDNNPFQPGGNLSSPF